jgi:DNA-binding NarL/FixJ family response regulator
MIRVLVLVESAIVRAGLEAMLRENERFELIRSDRLSGDLSRLPLLPSGSQPNVVLAEIGHVPALASPESPSLPLVLLVDEVSRSQLVRFLHTGANAILSNDARPIEIFAALEAAAAGLTALGEHERDLLLPDLSESEEEDGPALETLTTRELEVLVLMAQGLANKNIADRLAISEHTVKFHVSSILAKLSVSSRTEAVTKGLKNGLLVI